MTLIDDGGPAYPTTRLEGSRPVIYPGMSLRDYFAGQALMGVADPYANHADQYQRIAAQAYELADAMIAAREAK